MEKFLFEFDYFIYGICFRYTIIQYEENNTEQFAAGVALISVNEEFEMLKGNVFNNLEDAKVYLYSLSFSTNELEPFFINELLMV